MKYMMLLFLDPAKRPADEAAMNAIYAAYGTYTDGIRASGALVAGDQLSGAEARTIRATNGTTSVTAGAPQTRSEMLGGYYIIEAATPEAAAAIAGACPAAHGGSIELVPISEM